MKHYTEKTAAAVVNSLLKAARKTPRTGMHNPWTDKEGRRCVCDGFRAYRFAKLPDGVNVLPDDTEKDAPRQAVDFTFSALDAGSVVEMPAPDANAVKTALDDFRKGRTQNTIYDLGAEYPAVNVSYLYDLIRLFPAAKWYVYTDPAKRMISPIFAVCDEGAAALLPVRTIAKSKPRAAADPAPTVQRPANIPTGGEWFYVYSRLYCDNRYRLTDPGRGKVGITKFYAPRYAAEKLEQVKAMLDDVSAVNAGVSFQLRKANGRTPVYTVTTYTPEGFAAMFAA